MEEMAKSTVEMLQKRKDYQEKTKNALVIDMPAEANKNRRAGGRGRKDDYASDSGGSGDDGVPREPG